MSPTTTDSHTVSLVGIDLGTTNSALAWGGPHGAIHIFAVPQIAAPSEIIRIPTLPSFLYFPTVVEQQAPLLRLPWNDHPELIAGAFARDHGALAPARQITSAKSWLANPSVDRTAPILPWGADDGPRLSPMEASARLLAHLRDAWNHERASGPDSTHLRLEHLPVVLTVPASFDEEARELTVQAAQGAGLARVTLLEEPIAALYAWIAAHRRRMASLLPHGALVLVCDVGGGTTDFSLMRADAAGESLQFERIAIGDHLLLGGDNLDLALAALVERKLTDNGASKLSLTQRLTLRRKCSVAKEQLLSDAAIDHVVITILGSGRQVVSGGMSTTLTRDEAIRTLLDGFLPITAADDVPARDRRVGLRELGLPYESEPAITRHLAAFLARAPELGGGTARLAMPAAVLFNGGFFTPEIARTRVLDALESWSGRRPAVLVNDRPEAAVAVGAAFYARLRAQPETARRLLIRAGSARVYYVGLQSGDQGITAICVMPRGTEEGTTLSLERTFSVPTNQPVAFTLYSSTRAPRRPQRHRHLQRRRRGASPCTAGERAALRQAIAPGCPRRRPARRIHRDRHARVVVRVTRNRAPLAAGVQSQGRGGRSARHRGGGGARRWPRGRKPGGGQPVVHRSRDGIDSRGLRICCEWRDCLDDRAGDAGRRARNGDRIRQAGVAAGGAQATGRRAARGRRRPQPRSRLRGSLAEPGGVLCPARLRRRHRCVAHLRATQGLRRRPDVSEGHPVPGRVAGAVAAGRRRLHRSASARARATGRRAARSRSEKTRAAQRASRARGLAAARQPGAARRGSARKAG